MKTILIPIDFSYLSYTITCFGLELAQQINARVVLLHIDQILYSRSPGTELSKTRQLEQTANELHRFQEKIDDYQRHRRQPMVPISSRSEAGLPATGILDVASALKPCFIIMGIVGASNAWNKLVGSTTLAVMQQANCPIWLIPNALPLDSLRQFAYFADLDTNGVCFVKQAINLGERLRASLEAVPVPVLTDQEPRVASLLVSLFEDVYAPERIIFRHLTLDQLPEGIEAYVRSHWPDAIVVAHRNRRFLEKIFHPAGIHHLLLTTKRPLLVIPKPDAETDTLRALHPDKIPEPG